MAVAEQRKTPSPRADARLDSNHSNALGKLRTLLRETQRRQHFEIAEDHILSLLLVRRARSDLLGKDLFFDPAWDMLLELYAAKLASRTTSLSELALVTETPPSTAARWLAALNERGLTTSVTDPSDPSRILIGLSAEAVSKLERLASRWGSAFVSI